MSAPTLSQSFGPSIVAWQRVHGRHGLPWQGTRDPYRVWLSEVMLQQTQVSTVLAYYARFLERFPDVAALAAAPQDEVLAAWSGLGYYRRARLLHQCAQVVMAEHEGRFPATREGLEQLPGIGRSTAAAIAAFCFGAREAILDGNVKRVLARVLAVDDDLASAQGLQRMWAAAESLLPASGIEDYTQGLMDLGATVCGAKSPRCEACPVSEVCAARRLGRVDLYPRKTRRIQRTQRESVWLWLEHRGRVLLVQRPPEGIWASMWSLPEYTGFDALGRATHAWPGQGESLGSMLHVLTHLDWTLHPRRWQLPDGVDAEAFVSALNLGAPTRWVTPAEALASGLPVPWRRLFAASTLS